MSELASPFWRERRQRGNESRIKDSTDKQERRWWGERGGEKKRGEIAQAFVH